MKIRRVKNQTPQSSPPSMADGGTAGVECFVWEVLAPRLLHPSKLAFIQVLLERRRPLSLAELAEAAEISVDHAAYVGRSMAAAGVLEVVSTETGPEGDEPSYYFPKPPQAPPSPSPDAPATSA